MYKKTNIENLDRRIPFTVPSGYFQDLKLDIQNQCITKEKNSVVSVLQFKTLIPTLGILLVFIILFNNIETNISKVELTDDDIIAYLENNLSDELLYEYAILESEKKDDKLSEEINYLLEYNMDYNLIIDEL